MPHSFESVYGWVGRRWPADDPCRKDQHRQCRRCGGCWQCSECQCEEPEPLLSPYAGRLDD